MKKLIIIFILLFLCSTSHAYQEIRVYKDYSPVRILYILDGQNTELTSEKSGLSGNFDIVEESDIPIDRSDRQSWKIKSGKIEIDSDLKDVEDGKKLKKDSAINKLKGLGFTDEDLESLGLQ